MSLAPVAPTGGNTKTPVNVEEKRGNAAKRWCFTWNNYSQNFLAPLAPGLEGSEYIIGKEVGENGTQHLQGYVEFPQKVRPVGYKGFPKEIHWEKCKGDRASNVAYCSKEGDYCGTLRPPRPLPTVELTGWQLFCKAKFETEPVPRKIYWYWSREGKRGKSNMARYLAMQGALICDGKAADMKFLILKYKEKKGDYPICVVFDIPRSMEHYLSYNGMEQVSNAVFASTKYECDMVIAPYMHLFVFANFPPDMNNKDMSQDRFVVVNVD